MVGKVLFLFLIGFVASRNVQVALMIAVAYVVTLHIANKRATEEYIDFLKRERFMNYYELFDSKADNIKALTDKLCPKVKEMLESLDSSESDDSKHFLKDEKLTDAKKDITLQQAFEAAD